MLTKLTQLGQRFRNFKRSRSSKQRKTRISQFERLEARELLVAAVWNNIGNPFNVNGDRAGLIAPNDVLVLINELNQNRFSDPATGRLPRQIDEGLTPAFYDVSCDGFLTSNDVVRVINVINEGEDLQVVGNGQGVYPSVACSPELLEGDAPVTNFAGNVVLPDESSAVVVYFQDLQFDVASQGTILDAFEIEVTDASGAPLAFPYAANREAHYNWTETIGPAMGPGTATGTEGELSTVTIDLSGLPAGTAVQITPRLVNNDSDDNTSVIIRGFEVIDADNPAPAGVEPAGSRATLPGPVDESTLLDLTPSFTAAYGTTSLAGDDSELITELAVTNEGNQVVIGQLFVAIENISEPDAAAMRPDGFFRDGTPFFNLSAELDGQPLMPGETVRSRQIQFRNVSGERFSYQLSTYGVVNQAPAEFDSIAPNLVEAGQTYRYTAQAMDPEGQTLEYSLVSGPQDAVIDADSGEFMWPTAAEDVGSHNVTLRAADPYGLFVEQSFIVQVAESLQNRPPNFVSEPVTEAIASSGFEITTVATGAAPSGVVAVRGFRGPRLVSANAGDQSISVHAGQNNDRFDDVTAYSTGEPQPTGDPIDVGYSVDIGLPAAVLASDRNTVLGLDQGDLNGDGVLDLVAIAGYRVPNPFAFQWELQISRMLGDRNGAFGSPEIIGSQTLGATPSFRNLVVTDINNDGSADVIALQRSASTLLTVLGNGDGSFQPMTLTSTDVNLDDFRIEDLDQDGNVDLVGRQAAVGLGVVYDYVWKPGGGDGTFLDALEITSGYQLPTGFVSTNARPYDVVDIDGDGDRDIVIATAAGMDVLLNDGNQQFSVGASISRPGGGWPTYVLHVADFNGDDLLDIFSINSAQGQVELFVGDGTGVNFTHQAGVQLMPESGNWAGSDEPVDIDADGDLDFVFGNAWTGDRDVSPQVLVNDGAGSFQRVDYPMVTFPGSVSENNQSHADTARGAMFGDYNGDGVIDLSYFTTDSGFNGVGIRLGTRPGKFGSSRSAPIDGGQIRVGDFNGDGIEDLLATPVFNEPLMRTYLGNGDGSYGDPIPAVSVARPNAPSAVADFNRDGLMDFVSTRAAPEGSRYYVALSNGNGTFTVSDDQLAGSFFGYHAYRVADFNNDGFPDFMAKYSGAGHRVDVYLNDPADPGVFDVAFGVDILAEGVNASGFNNAFTAGDFNADGNMDFAVVNGDNNGGEPMWVEVYAGDGAGDFSLGGVTEPYQDAFVRSAAGLNAYYAGDLDSGDLNEDGFTDVVSFTYAGPLVLLGDGDGTFTTTDFYPRSPLNGRARQGYVVDFDQDGHQDLVQATGFFGETVNVHRGAGNGTFADPIRIGSLAGGDLSFADLDHDGHLDIVHAVGESGNYNAPDTAIYSGTRDGLVDVLAVDLDGDGNEEVLAVNEANDRLKLFAGDNLGRLTRQNDLLTGRAPQSVTTADLDGDNELELITANRAGRSLTIFSGSVQDGYSGQDTPLPNGAIDVAAADLDGDGHVDVVALDDTDDALWIYTGDGTSILTDPVAIALGDKPGRFVLADATGDGDIDAIITLPETKRLMILSSLGSQPASPPIYVELPSAPSDVAVVDLNDDGNPDLAAILPELGVLSILYGRGNNQFAKAQQIQVGEAPTRMSLADADEDGRTDLLVTNTGDNTTSVIYNRFDPNEVYRYDSDAIDPDDDTLTYDIADGPGGLIINSTTGELLWAASPDQVGVHEVTISADDGRGGVATQSFKIDVQSARENAPPLIATEPLMKIGAAEPFQYQATALDNDNDALRYRLLDGPAGATIDATNGEISWDGRTEALIIGPNGQAGDIAVPPNASTRPASLTLEGWFNFDNPPPSNNSLFNHSRQSGFASAYRLNLWENRSLDFYMDSASSSGVISAPFAPEFGRWYHIALTIDDATQTATTYIDGVAAVSGTIPGSIVYDNSSQLTVGSRPFPTRGLIVENARMWNVARSAAEISEGMGQQYDGNTQLVFDYRFDGPNTRSVRDYSPAGNDGFLVGSQLEPQQVNDGLAEVGLHAFTVAVEDGRGGYDEQNFNIEVVPELRGDIVGHLFDDLNGDGDQDDGSEEGVPAEPSLEDWLLYIDFNANAYPDPDEPQAITDADGNYRLGGLLPGDYPVRLSPVAGYDVPAGPTNVSVAESAVTAHDLAIQQLSLSHIRGQLKTEDGDAIAYWKVYADLDGDGQRGDNEPMAMSDRDGNYALTGLNAGTYNVLADLPAGWADTAGRGGLTVNLGADEVAAGHDFVLEARNTSVTGGVHFVTMPNPAIEARQTFAYASIAMSIVDEPIAYDLSLAPDGMTMDPDTGLVAWRPRIDQVGEHLVILRATSQSGSMSLQDFNVEVSAPNTDPVITELPAIHANQDLAYVSQVIAQDAQLTNLTYSLERAPNGAAIDAATGLVSWNPAAADVGVAEFMVSVTDGAGGGTTGSWAVTVEADRPSALPLQVRLPGTMAAVGTQYFSRVTAHDALDRPVSWSLTSGPAGLTVDSDGTILWTPSSGDLGTAAVELTAMTADDETETVSFALDVTSRQVNERPTIESMPVGSMTLGNEYQYDVLVSDADGDIHAFELLEAPAGMSIHPSWGTVRWAPAADQLGETEVLIQVSDPSGETATQQLTLKVSRFGGPPKITSVAPTEAGVGAAYLYSVVAEDAEGDPLRYSLLAAPAGLSIVDTTGEVSWTPTQDQLGPQEVVIQVSDGVGGAATQAFAVRVSDGAPNEPPTITSTAPRFGAVGMEFSYMLVADDPESTPISYSLGRGPDGMTIDATTGQARWTPAANQTGKHVVTLLATDAGGASAVESFEFDVLAANQQPMIRSTAPREVTAGAEFMYDVLANDADLDQLRYELSEAPSGAEIDSFGRIRWMTEVALIGAHDFTVTVNDPRGGEDTQSFSLEVIEDLVPPKLSLIESRGDSSRNTLPWQGPFIVYARAIDNVAVASLTLQANGQDIPLDAAGTATFTFEDWNFQTIDATATAIDTNGNETTKTITFDYDAPFGWTGAGAEGIPTAEITSPTDAESVTGMVTISGTADHADFALYTLSYRHVDDTQFTEFLRGDVPVIDGELGVWDTSLLLNDEYVIRLQVATTEGTVNVVERHIGLSGELKLGNFRLNFTDIVIPVAGIPVEITRIYDTLQADREGDFGYGWRLEYRNTDLRVGLPKTGLESIGIYAPLRPGVKVYLNVPGEGRQGFTFTPEIRVLPGWGGDNLVLGRPRFTPDPGVTSTLSTGTSGYLQVNELGELHAPGGIPYNPASPDFGGAYVLSNRDGIVFRIDGTTGLLRSASDRNGNTLTFDESGVVATRGNVSIDIRRDNQGRIEAIVDPSGETIEYRYGNGDLLEVEDRVGNVTRHEYSNATPHYLESVVDPLGNTGIRVDYDENGRLIRTFYSGDEAFDLTYDPDQLLITTVDPLEGKTFTVFEQSGRLVSRTDPLGRTTAWTYDQNGFVTSETDPSGATTSYRNDSRGNVIETTSADGSKASTVYNHRNDISSFTTVSGRTTSYTYDSNGNPVAIKTEGSPAVRIEYLNGGQSTDVMVDGVSIQRTEYSGSGLPTSIEYATGLVAQTEYDATSRPVKVTTKLPDGRIRTEQTSYDANGNIIELNLDGAVSRFSYDGAGNRVSETNPLGHETTFEYDEDGQLVELIDAEGAINLLSYDVMGRLVRRTDAAGNLTQYEYDAVGNQIAIIYPDNTPDDLADNPVSRFEYDANDQLTKEINENGFATSFEHDSLGRTIATISPDGGREEFRYNVDGSPTINVDALGRRTEFTYDVNGNETKILFADGAAITKEYGDKAQPLSITDENGATTAFQLDDTGKVIAVIDASGHTTSFVLDAFGETISRTDANGNTTEFEYDSNRRQIGRTRAGGQVATFEFDLTGNLTREVDERGVAIDYEYDRAGRMSRKIIGGEVHTEFEYDSRGLLIRVSDPSGVVSMEYDARGRLVAREGPGLAFVRYGYDDVGNVTTLATNAGMTNYRYDAMNRLIAVVDPNDRETTYRYDLNGNELQARYFNGATETRSYDMRDRLKEIRVEDEDGSLVSQSHFELDPTGRLIRSTIDGIVREITYDSLYQIVADTVTEGTDASWTKFRYDAVGNRMSQTKSDGSTTDYTYDVNDQLIQTLASVVGQVDLTYDAAGNVVRRESPNEVHEFEWDAEGRLVRSKITEGGKTTEETHAYDWQGNLIAKTVDGELQRFVVGRVGDLMQRLAALDSSDQVVRSSTFGNRIISEDFDNGPTEFLLSGRLNEIYLALTPLAEIAARIHYDTFGSVLSLEGELSSLRRFGGEVRSATTGMDHLRARWYVPTDGRFASVDPFAGVDVDPLSLHRYIYAFNDPINVNDPLGLNGDTTLAGVLGRISLITTIGAIFFDAIGWEKTADTLTVISILTFVGSLAVGAFEVLAARTAIATEQAAVRSAQLEAEVAANQARVAVSTSNTLVTVSNGFLKGEMTTFHAAELLAQSVLKLKDPIWAATLLRGIIKKKVDDLIKDGVSSTIQAKFIAAADDMVTLVIRRAPIPPG